MKSEKVPDYVDRWLDYMYDLLFGEKDEKEVKVMGDIKCPSCDADMDYDEESGVYTCPECGYTESR